MLVHHTISAQPANSNLSGFPRLQQGMRTLAIQEKSRSDANESISLPYITKFGFGDYRAWWIEEATFWDEGFYFF